MANYLLKSHLRKHREAHTEGMQWTPLLYRMEPFSETANETITEPDGLKKQKEVHTNGLKKKKEVHTGEKPLHCAQCTKSSAEDILLKRQIKVQADEIDFSCDQSIRSFAEDGLLRGHREAHAGERKSSCNQCGRPCLEQDSLE